MGVECAINISASNFLARCFHGSLSLSPLIMRDLKAKLP